MTSKTRKKIRKFVSSYAVHILITVIVANFFVTRTIRYLARADSCISQAEWDSTYKTDPNKCFMLYDRNGRTEAFEAPILKIGSLRTHQGNDICGTNITSILPGSHTSNPAKYLTDTYRGELKSSCVIPTATPQPTAVPTAAPQPSATSIPTSTSKQNPTPTTKTNSPTATPKPSSTPKPSGAPQPSVMPTPDLRATQAASPGLLTQRSTGGTPKPLNPSSQTPQTQKTDHLLKISQVLEFAGLILTIITLLLVLVKALKPKPTPVKK